MSSVCPCCGQIVPYGSTDLAGNVWVESIVTGSKGIDELKQKHIQMAIEAVDKYFYDIPRCIDDTDAVELGSEVIEAIRERFSDES